MTTPARKINETYVISRPVTRYAHDGSIVNVQMYNVYNGGFRDERPESVSHPIDKNGWREPTTWYHNSTTTHNPARGEARYNWNDPDPAYGWNIYSDGVGMSNPPQVASKALDKNLENRALISALSKLKTQDFNTGVFVGEGRETISMLATSIYRVYSGIKSFKHLNPDLWRKVKKIQVGGLAKKHWREIPQAWLELQYGWIPLMSDISGACKALSDMAQKTVPRITVSGIARDTISETKRFENTLVPGPYCDVKRTTNTRVKVTLTYELKSAQEALKTRLGLTNPLEIVWEVLPWSFVFDWFYTVGPWLGVLDADRGWDFKSGICSIKREGGERILKYGTTGNPKVVYSTLVPATYDWAEFERRIYGSAPVPGPYVKGPLSAKHVVNLLALLAATIKD